MTLLTCSPQELSQLECVNWIDQEGGFIHEVLSKSRAFSMQVQFLIGVLLRTQEVLERVQRGM